jgi:hypothetical protein
MNIPQTRILRLFVSGVIKISRPLSSKRKLCKQRHVLSDKPQPRPQAPFAEAPNLASDQPEVKLW